MTLVLAKLTGPYDEVRGTRGVEVREDKVLEREGGRGEREREGSESWECWNRSSMKNHVLFIVFLLS